MGYLQLIPQQNSTFRDHSLLKILFREHSPIHLSNYLDGPTGVASLKTYPSLHTTDLKIEDVEVVVVHTLVMMLRITTAVNPRPQQIVLPVVMTLIFLFATTKGKLPYLVTVSWFFLPKNEGNIVLNHDHDLQDINRILRGSFLARQ